MNLISQVEKAVAKELNSSTEVDPHSIALAAIESIINYSGIERSLRASLRIIYTESKEELKK